MKDYFVLFHKEYGFVKKSVLGDKSIVIMTTGDFRNALKFEDKEQASSFRRAFCGKGYKIKQVVNGELV